MALSKTPEETVVDKHNLIERDPEKMSGTPVFHVTRVPVKNLFDHLEGIKRLDDFLDQFPTVTREQALGMIRLSEEWLRSI